jgi:hypothetical protein
MKLKLTKSVKSFLRSRCHFIHTSWVGVGEVKGLHMRVCARQGMPGPDALTQARDPGTAIYQSDTSALGPSSALHPLHPAVLRTFVMHMKMYTHLSS